MLVKEGPEGLAEWTHESVPDGQHARCMKEGVETGELADAAVEDVERFVRVSGEALDGLILGCEEVQNREVGHEHQSCTVGENINQPDAHRHPVEEVECVEAEE